MKKRVLIPSLCVLALSVFSLRAQQKEIKPDSVPLIGGFMPLSSVPDTAAVPIIAEQPSFYNYNFVYKQRLDSIQKMVPLKYNEFVQKYIDIYSSRKDMIGKMLGLSGYYFPIFEQALKTYNIPEEIKYLPIIESSMNPMAVSRVGATGLWQFMFTTAKGYGLTMDNFVDERRDPVQASYAAAAYFRDAYAELGDWLLAIAAYNCGKGNVNKAIAKANSRDFWEIRQYLPLETRNYVPAFIAAVYIMNCANCHQIKFQECALHLQTDTLLVNRFVSLPLLAQALNIEEDALCGLNPGYKRKIVNGTAEMPKRIVMPKAGLANFAMVYDVLNNSDFEVDTQIIQASNDDRRLRHKYEKVSKPAVIFHKVSSGQNLSAIAEKYHVEVQDLKVWNKLKGNSIQPGQRLIVSRPLEAGKRSAAQQSKQYISYKAGPGQQNAGDKM